MVDHSEYPHQVIFGDGQAWNFKDYGLAKENFIDAVLHARIGEKVSLIKFNSDGSVRRRREVLIQEVE